MVKNLPANAGNACSIPESGQSPGKGSGSPLNGKSHGQRSLMGHSLWGHKKVGHSLVTK